MKFFKKIIFPILLFTSNFFVIFSCQSITFGDRDFYIKKNTLYRGKETYTVRAFYEPKVALKGSSLSVMVPILAKIAEVGGNTLALDLLCNPDKQVPEPEIVNNIIAYADRAKEQYMTLLIRIAPMSPPNKNKELIKNLRKEFAGRYNVLYWFDGPYLEEWIKKARKVDRNWIIVGKSIKADILLCDSKDTQKENKLKIFTNYIDEKNFPNLHLIFDFSEKNLELVENTFSNITHCEPIKPTEFENIISREEKNDGFIPLFDGKTLRGWWFLGENQQSFNVNPEGYIEWQSKGGKALMSCERYDDFILRLEWKIEKNGNSGVWVRAPRGGRASKIGFEIQMLGDSEKNELTNESTGAIYKVLPPKVKATKPEGQWNELEIVCQGPRVKAILNGNVIQDVNFDEIEELKYRLRKGFIGLTDHGNYCAFRNIRIKPLK
ncbi:MAG: DUF1080 domain-containing protein [Candidatus Hydrogenedentes bacterium]|nr:DUF1080 domain-containing protein [Candidatus Hydrogenedentota bacterium]